MLLFGVHFRIITVTKLSYELIKLLIISEYRLLFCSQKLFWGISYDFNLGTTIEALILMSLPIRKNDVLLSTQILSMMMLISTHTLIFFFHISRFLLIETIITRLLSLSPCIIAPLILTVFIRYLVLYNYLRVWVEKIVFFS